jgi:hypothetical protein
MTEKKQFKRLEPNDPLVKKIATGKYPWWNNLVALSHTDKRISIQVRGSYLNVYSTMGSLLKVEMAAGKLVCTTHYKYLIDDLANVYVNLVPEGDHLAVEKPTCPLVTSLLEGKHLKTVQNNIAAHAGAEKMIQSKLVWHNRNTLLDAEIAFNDEGEQDDNAVSKTRIDLVNLDKRSNEIVFAELKQLSDVRLHNSEINQQIKKYVAFAEKHKDEIIKAYRNVIRVKELLGILPKTSKLAKAKIECVNSKPVLAIACSNQKYIDNWKDEIKSKLHLENLTGLYFFGTNVDLNLNSDKNKELLPRPSLLFDTHAEGRKKQKLPQLNVAIGG